MKLINLCTIFLMILLILTIRFFKMLAFYFFPLPYVLNHISESTNYLKWLNYHVKAENKSFPVR